jgi:tetratricopeptide (TPR) repeat protein
MLEVREEIKAGLKMCNKILNKDESKEQEYQLFKQLALSYLTSENHHDYPKVVGIYEYMKKLKPNKQEELEIRIQNVEKKFIRQFTKNIPEIFLEIGEYISRLEAHRNRVKEELKKVYHTGMERLYLETNKFFIGEGGLVKCLINDCIKQLGDLPKVMGEEVRYSIFGTGSMALGTMTPWSDLEFGILIQDGLGEDSERIKEFFRNLTSLLHIKVVRFGESPLRMLGIKELNDFTKGDNTNAEINWFFDDLTRSGFSFDGPHSHACKTPLGRKGFEGHKDFELIGAVEDLCEFQKEKWWASDPHLVQALTHVILIHGDNELFDNYKKGLEKFKEINKERAFKILKEDAEKLDPNKEFLDQDREGTILNVKKEIYRFPDRILSAIGDCLGFDNMTSWQLLKELSTKRKLTKEGAKNLKLALSVATELRLRTYANNNGQREDISMLSSYETSIKELQSDELVESVFYLQDLEPLYKYYYVVLSLNSALEKARGNTELEAIIGKCTNFYSDIPIVKGYVYKRFLQYDKAIEEFKHSKLDIELLTLYAKVGRSDDALGLAKELAKNSSIFEINNPQNAALLFNLGYAYAHGGEYPEALKYFKNSLNMRKRIYKGDHNEIAIALDSVGNICGELKDYDNALLYHNQSLDIYQRLYAGNHHNIARSLNNIGSIYGYKRMHKEALECYKKSLKIYQRFYKGYHPSIADSLNNIGNTYRNLNEYQNALVYCEIGLKMQKAFDKFGSIKTAGFLYNIACIYIQIRNYKKAVQYLEEADIIFQRLQKIDDVIKCQELCVQCYKKSRHRRYEISRYLNNLACMYHVKALSSKEIEKDYLTRAKETFEEAIKITCVSSGLYTEYAMFLIKHHKDGGTVEEIVSLLEEAKVAKNITGLGYTQFDKETTVWALREFLDKNASADIEDASILANYLLCKIYQQCGEVEKAQSSLNSLAQSASGCKVAEYLLSSLINLEPLVTNIDLNRLLQSSIASVNTPTVTVITNSTQPKVIAMLAQNINTTVIGKENEQCSRGM